MGREVTHTRGLPTSSKPSSRAGTPAAAVKGKAPLSGGSGRILKGRGGEARCPVPAPSPPRGPRCPGLPPIPVPCSNPPPPPPRDPGAHTSLSQLRPGLVTSSKRLFPPSLGLSTLGGGEMGDGGASRRGGHPQVCRTHPSPLLHLAEGTLDEVDQGRAGFGHQTVVTWGGGGGGCQGDPGVLGGGGGWRHPPLPPPWASGGGGAHPAQPDPG